MVFKINRKLVYAFKASQQLGLKLLSWYAWYQVCLRSGYLRWRTSGIHHRIEGSSGPIQAQYTLLQPIFTLPDRNEINEVLDQQGQTKLLLEADELLKGQVKIFGGERIPFKLKLSEKLEHWTVYEGRISEFFEQDIKYIWEIGRFGWAYTLARAYTISQREEYVKTFWKYTREFLKTNPPYLGPHWISAQEVALRMIAFVFAYQVFAGSQPTTAQDKAILGWAIAVHAERIPPTLSYAHSQNNNHLLSEAAGLYTAGLALPTHPYARKWRNMGWKLFNSGLQHQITPDGSYIQHSCNYHRLMLQLALWVNMLASHAKEQLPDQTHTLLSAAAHWLHSMLDPISGGVPNLGPNDGAYILPLTSQPFDDYRPVVKAAQMAFAGKSNLSNAEREEMVLWLANRPLPRGTEGTPHFFKQQKYSPIFQTPSIILKPQNSNSWAYLRVAHFTSRPGHADQLHVDLWWRGLNVALDAGTYLYNTPPPWNNALRYTPIHNTITVDGQDQMTNAGRFLYLDWAQADILKNSSGNETGLSITAQHHGYQRLGLTHQRTVNIENGDHWVVTDQLLPVTSSQFSRSSISHTARLHWLLPDWPWILDPAGHQDRYLFKLHSPYGWIEIMVAARQISGTNQTTPLSNLSIMRAGYVLYGMAESSPTRGWVSPSYGRKEPAISFSIEIEADLPLEFTTDWQFPAEELK